MKVAVWSPLPPTPSGIADHTAELLPALARHHDVTAVVEDEAAVKTGAVPGVSVVCAREAPAVDLDLYQVGNSPAHLFVYRAALERPGVVVLHEWVLHDLVWHEAVDRGDPSRHVREMRRSHGEAGSFVARQVASGRGGSLLPALFAANDRLLERSLGAVTLTREAAARLAKRHPGLEHLVLPQHHAGGPGATLSKARARADLGLSPSAPIVTAAGLATPSKRIHSLVRAIGRLRREHPSLRLVLAGAVDPDLPLAGWAEEAGIGDGLVLTGRLPLEGLVAHLVAADVVSALRFPSRGEMSAILVRAMGVGRPVLVTAGTPAAEEMPPGTVVPVTPGARESAELVSLLRRLLADEALRAAIGAEARRHVLEAHDLDQTASALAGFLVEVHRRRGERRREIDADRAHEGSLTAYFLEEVGQAARELGLEARHLRPRASSRAPRPAAICPGRGTLSDAAEGPAPELSIVIPAFNEAERLPGTLSRVREWLASWPHRAEILVVDDGSTDGTAEAARDASRSPGEIRVLRHAPNRGKGYAVRRGMLAARGRLRLMTDADLSTPIEELPRLIDALGEGADVAIGSRAVEGARIEVHQPAYREAMGRVFNGLVQLLLLPGLQDTQCGFKLFSAQAAEEAFEACRLDGFSFDVEALYVARRRGRRIAELPVTWRNDEATRVSLGGGGAAFVDLLRIRLLAWRGAYGPAASRPGGDPGPST